MTPVSQADQTAFYQSATVALLALDRAGSGRQRLDSEAWARWRQFKGDLLDADLLDLLVRDAAVAHPTGFAPRAVFDLRGLADDDAFGPDWPGVDAALAARLLRTTAPDSSVISALRQICVAWELRSGATHGSLARLNPSTRLAVAGAGAVLAVAQAWLADNGRPRIGLDWSDQVTVVTDRPGERQLTGIAAALLGAPRSAPFCAPSATRGLRFDLVVTSDDAAAPALRALADHHPIVVS